MMQRTDDEKINESKMIFALYVRNWTKKFLGLAVSAQTSLFVQNVDSMVEQLIDTIMSHGIAPREKNALSIVGEILVSTLSFLAQKNTEADTNPLHFVAQKLAGYLSFIDKKTKEDPTKVSGGMIGIKIVMVSLNNQQIGAPILAECINFFVLIFQQQRDILTAGLAEYNRLKESGTTPAINSEPVQKINNSLDVMKIWAETLFVTLERYESKQFFLFPKFCENEYFIQALTAILGIMMTSSS